MQAKIKAITATAEEEVSGEAAGERGDGALCVYRSDVVMQEGGVYIVKFVQSRLKNTNKPLGTVMTPEIVSEDLGWVERFPDKNLIVCSGWEVAKSSSKQTKQTKQM
jgi:hypothetical protein